jgi:hypothetical protein
LSPTPGKRIVANGIGDVHLDLVSLGAKTQIERAEIARVADSKKSHDDHKISTPTATTAIRSTQS